MGIITLGSEKPSQIMPRKELHEREASSSQLAQQVKVYNPQAAASFSLKMLQTQDCTLQAQAQLWHFHGSDSVREEGTVKKNVGAGTMAQLAD